MSGETIFWLLFLTFWCVVGVIELVLRLLIAWSHRRIRMAQRKTAQAERQIGETLLQLMGIKP